MPPAAKHRRGPQEGQGARGGGADLWCHSKQPSERGSPTRRGRGGGVRGSPSKGGLRQREAPCGPRRPIRSPPPPPPLTPPPLTPPLLGRVDGRRPGRTSVALSARFARSVGSGTKPSFVCVDGSGSPNPRHRRAGMLGGQAPGRVGKDAPDRMARASLRRRLPGSFCLWREVDGGDPRPRQVAPRVNPKPCTATCASSHRGTCRPVTGCCATDQAGNRPRSVPGSGRAPRGDTPAHTSRPLRRLHASDSYARPNGAARRWRLERVQNDMRACGAARSMRSRRPPHAGASPTHAADALPGS